MKEGWTYKKFADCIDKIPKQRQVKSKDYKSTGLYPIVSQEKELISGYWDDESYLYKHSKPIIIFGDHTKVVKYVDFDFVVGADGTQILSPKSDVDAKFFYYTLLATPIRTLGYARHFKLLKERSFKFPSLSEQQHIVSRLDSAFAHIDELKANAEKQLSEARALFQKALTKAMEPKEGWEEKKLGEICQIKGGKRLPKGYVLSTEPLYNRYITVADFTINGTIIPSTVKYISEEVYKTIHRYTITSADVYVTIVGSTVGKAGIIPPELDGANLTENACKLVLNKDCDKRFVYYIMCSDYVIKQEQLLTKVSAQPKLALNRLASIVVYIPSLSEQQRIVSRLDSLSAHVRELEEVTQKTIAECDALKQALLRQVFE